MKPKTLVLMVVAIVCGLGASYMTSRLLAERGPAKEDEKVKVLVAKKALDMGISLKNPDAVFHVKLFAKGQEPKNCIVKVEELKDRMLKRPLREGDHVTPDDLIAKDGGNELAAKLPAGMRAVGIKVTNETSAHGFTCLPMSRVDIIHTVRRQTDNESFSQVLLENVLVLAADDTTKRDTERGGAMPANVVTVALTPEDALKVTIAKDIGTLSLVLRKFNDNERVDGKRVTAAMAMRNLGGGSGPKNDVPDSGPAKSAVAVAPPSIPDLPIEVKAPPEDPNYKHKVVIIEGDRQRTQEYLLDKLTNKVANQDVVRSEPQQPNVAPPVPALVVPQAPVVAPTPTPTPPGPAAVPKVSDEPEGS